MINARYINPYGSLYNMKDTTNKTTNKRSRMSRKKREQARTRAKADSPGVPPNTCPYIDLVQTMVTDLQHSYDRLREKGEYNPAVDNIAQHAQDTLELIRHSNETLRDNSAYWYNQFKNTL